MIKRLLLHIGYPKTATTTLQASVLSTLHARGQVNYIGNAELSDDPRLKLTDSLLRDVFFRKEREVGLHGLLAAQAGFLRGLLRDDRPNVLSSEYFTIPGFGDYPASAHPAMLHRAFGGANLEVRVLVTTRAQVSLLNSFYAHFYEWIHRYGDAADIERGVPDIDDWIARRILEADGPVREGFDFDRVARHYAEVFGAANLRLNLFEDLKAAPDLHFETWAEATGLPAGLFIDTWEKAEAQRVRGSGRGDSYVVTIPWGAARWMQARNARRAAGRPVSPSERLLRQLGRHLPPRKIEVARMQQSTAERLRALYRDGNRAVLQRHGVDLGRVATFGYL